MRRVSLLLSLCIVAGSMAHSVPGHAATSDDVRADLARLAERLDQLEAENQALKRRVAELESHGAPVPAPAPPVNAAAALPPAPVASAAAPPAELPWYERVKVNGSVIGDAYVVPQNHDPVADDANGFWIRRGYLWFDAQLGDRWTSRLRFEVNSPGDFTTNSRLNGFVKDALLTWKRGGQELTMGLAPTPTIDFAENFWGMRSLEKAPLDLYRYGSTRDTGIAWRGASANGRVFTHAMVGNGSGDGSETNQGKKAMLGLGFKPVAALVLRLYADYEDRTGATDRTTWGAFAGWTGESSRYGVEYAYQQRETTDGSNGDVAVASAFGIWKLAEHGQLIARYDRNFDGYDDASRIPFYHFADDMKFDLALLAWQQKLNRRISLIPNVEYVTYRATNGVPAPDDDLYGKLTLYFEF
jgi:hypothetical protein